MLRSDRLRQALALCVVAAWASLAGLSFADTLEDARKVSPRENQTADQAVQGALVTPAVKSAPPSPHVLKPRPLFTSSRHPAIHPPGIVQVATSRPFTFTLHDPPLIHRFKLFQLFSIYRL